MSSLDKAAQTQLNNIQEKTSRSLEELKSLASSSGLTKHGQIRDYFKNELGLGYGDANALAHFVRKADGEQGSEEKNLDEVLVELYSGKKGELRPIHEAIWTEILKMGPFETVPKKNYLSLRRKKQFAMLGPATNTRFEVGLNVKNLPEDPMLNEQPQGRMCNYIVRLTDPTEIDDQLYTWIRAAYESAG